MPQINVLTLPAALLLVLAVQLVATYSSDAQLNGSPFKRMQTKEDIRKCGYGSISYVNDWCIQWSYHAPRR